MTKADLLSRRAGHERGENDNTDLVLLKPEWFVNELKTAIEADEVELLQRIKRATKNRDRRVVKALQNEEKDWAEDETGIVTWQDRIYVPKDKRLREDIIRQHHDSPLAGHPGRYKTQELITRNYWWPGIHCDVREYVTGCDTCQRMKPHRVKPPAPLVPNEIPTEPWKVVSIDLIGELPESQGHNAICVIVDRFSKQVHAIPTTIEITSEGIARILRDHVFKLHGIPEKVISDRGPQFVSSFMKDLYRLLGIIGNPSTAYHPQTDGQTERINQEIEQYLRIFVNYRQTDWAEYIDVAEFAYNNRKHKTTGMSPFYAMYGWHPHLEIAAGDDSNVPEAINHLAELRQVQ